MLTKSPDTLYFTQDEMTWLKQGKTLELTFIGDVHSEVSLTVLQNYRFNDEDSYKKQAYRKLIGRTFQGEVVRERYKFSLMGLEESGFKCKLMSDLRSL